MKNTKKIMILILSFSLLLSVAALLIGCDGNKEETTTAAEENEDKYSVTVVNNEGNAVSGVSLMITDSKSIFKAGTTDANGNFGVEVEGDDLGVMIVSVPDGYEKPGAVSGSLHALFGDKKNVTVTLQKETQEVVTYTVKLVDQNGDPIVGAELQLCPNGTCLADQFITDENGTCTKDMKPGLPVDIKIKELPTGYEMPDELAESNGYHAKIEAGESEITIEINKGYNE